MPKQFEQLKNSLVVHLKGEIDQYAVSDLRDMIDVELMISEKKNLILDLDGVTLMDSSGIGLIAGRYKTVKAVGGKLAVCGGNSSVKKMLALSGIEKFIKFCKSSSEADANMKN